MDWQDRNSFVKIVEQPAPKALRFRYECEGRSAGSLPGINSSGDRKTYPKIQIQNYVGRAVVVVSCVTVDPPYRPHPHNLVGKEGCKKGVCTMEINNEDMSCEFSNLGIQCVKKKDIEDSLKVREDIRVDPFRTGFGHKSQPGSIDLNSVRLCFQVFLEGPEKGQFKLPLKAVVSEPIYDKKAINDLTIMKLSDCSSPVVGNKEIILLCDKVSKDDIEIRFFEDDPETGAVTWEAFGDFQPSDVHKQFAISFRTPQYHNLEIPSAARVKIQLRCPSKETTSVSRPFDYIPLTSGRKKWTLANFRNLEDSAIVEDTKVEKRKLDDILDSEDAYKCLNEFLLETVNQQQKVEGVYDFNPEGFSSFEIAMRNPLDLDLPDLSQQGQPTLVPMDTDPILSDLNCNGQLETQLTLTDNNNAPHNLNESKVNLNEMVLPPMPLSPPRPPKNLLLMDTNTPPPPPLPPKRNQKNKKPGFLKTLFSPKKKQGEVNKNLTVVETVGNQKNVVMTTTNNSAGQGQVLMTPDLDLDVTEAEHYALYVDDTPTKATDSEFDEMSAFYCPVEK